MEFPGPIRLPTPPVPTREIRVERPPALPKVAPGNPLARLTPVVILVAVAGMATVYFTSGMATARGPMSMFFPVMMMTSALGAVAYAVRGGGRTAELTADRQRYLRYLDAMDAVLADTTEAQHRALQWCHPEPASLWTLAGTARMWERRPDDPDFGVIRVGLGERGLCAPLTAPEFGPAEETDPLTVSAAQRLIRRRTVVNDVPVTVALLSAAEIVVSGDSEAARALARAAVLQLAVFHGPDAVAIAAASADQSQWEWLKWLPHHAPSPDQVTASHLVVLADGGPPFDAGWRQAARQVTVVYLGSAHRDGLGLEVAGDVVTFDDGSTARADAPSLVLADTCARRLAPFRAHRPRPASARGWLGLIGIDDPARFDPTARWAAQADGQLRPVPIGVTPDGAPVRLDINEAARNGVGPHGLCVGATGSGKSELLRTLALGVITTHPPEVVNLVLIDFKGGATFFGLERARHVAAVITNLADEAHLVMRMNDALSGELHRRQELLRAAGNFADAVEYRRARSRGAALPALPSLFIMVDEFSELLSQHPDFAELFVAIGRLGRSLGIHLLLASQRLDEGRLRGLDSHLSYRICLKTFSAADSRAVLGVPDAYHLPGAPGAAYLSTAEGELLRFQTAFVSGPVDSTSAPTHAETPRPFTASPPPRPRAVARDHESPTVLESIMAQVAGRGAPAHQVWLAPLGEPPALDVLMGTTPPGDLAVPIGVVDCPYEQRRDPLVVDLTGATGNVAIVGAPQSGKSTAVGALLLALAEHHSPREVGFYCLDFGGGALSTLRGLPHIGALAGRRDVDLCRRTVAVIESVISARETRFRQLGIASMADYRRLRATRSRTVDDPYGDVFLVVDGWATLRQEFEALEIAITAIAGRGLSYGVHVVLTASRWAELRPALKDQIATRIELRLGEPAESEMDRRRARLLTGRPPGTGITAAGREFRIAQPRREPVERLRVRWHGVTAPQVRLLPTHVAHRDLIARTPSAPHRLVIGLDEHELQPVTLDFTDQTHLLVLGEARCGKTAVLRLVCREILRTCSAAQARIEIVDFRRSLLGVVESDHLGGYAMSPPTLTARLQAVVETLTARMPGPDISQQELRTRSWWSGPEIYLVVDDYELVAGPTGNPLTPVVEFLPHARDLGLHVIVARRSGGAARAMFDPVLGGLRELGSVGVMMSAGPDEGTLLGSVRPTRLPPGRARLIRDRDAGDVVQVAWAEP